MTESDLPSSVDSELPSSISSDLPIEADEADAVEQATTLDEPSPFAGPQGREDAADEGDIAESRLEVPLDEDDDRR